MFTGELFYVPFPALDHRVAGLNPAEKRVLNLTTIEPLHENQQNGICPQRRLGSTRASSQSDQSLRCPHEESLGP